MSLLSTFILQLHEKTACTAEMSRNIRTYSNSRNSMNAITLVSYFGVYSHFKNVDKICYLTAYFNDMLKAYIVCWQQASKQLYFSNTYLTQ